MNPITKTRVVFTALFGLCSLHATADIGLSVTQMNAYMDKCYEQSQLAPLVEARHKLNPLSCSKVLRNEWLTKEAESNMRLNRGIIYMAKGDTTRAIKDFEKLLKTGAHQYQAHVAIAQILESENEYSVALEHYDNAIALDKTNPRLLKKRAQVAQVVAQEKRQRLSMINKRHNAK